MSVIIIVGTSKIKLTSHMSARDVRNNKNNQEEIQKIKEDIKNNSSEHLMILFIDFIVRKYKFN